MSSPSNARSAGGRNSLLDLEHFLPYRLSLLTNTVSSGIARSYREPFGISVQEWRILVVLARYPGLTAKEVAERTAMDKVAVSRAVKNLVGKELLLRKTDPEDRRRIHLHITPDRGLEIVNRVVPLARKYENDLLDALSPPERETLFDLIEKLQLRAGLLNRS